MPKRKKYPRLPSGFGSIRYLGKNRKNPYAVHPPAKLADDLTDYIRPPALCYVDDWYTGFAVLNAYHAGTYQPGDELTFKQYKRADASELDDFCRRLITDYTMHAHADHILSKKKKTFSDVYGLFYEYKYGENAKRKLSKQSQDSTRAAFKNCSILHSKVFEDLRHKDLQECIDSCTLKSSSVENMVFLIKQMYKYAILYDLCDRDYSSALKSPENDDEHGVPFSDEELKILWENKDDPIVEMILIMCYSGYRIAAYRTIEVNTAEWYFKGGVKNAYSKNRIVPIHSAIQSLVSHKIKRTGCILKEPACSFRKSMYETLEKYGIKKHTPHDCRHTFSRLCESYHVPDADRKRMMGHSFGSDITNGIYGHRTLDELRASIELIKCEHLVTSNPDLS